MASKQDRLVRSLQDTDVDFADEYSAYLKAQRKGVAAGLIPPGKKPYAFREFVRRWSAKYPQDTDKFARGHWKRDQDKYHTEIGLTEMLRREPIAGYGAAALSSDQAGMIPQYPETDPGIYGVFDPNRGTRGQLGINLDNARDPQEYALTMAHELGHAGSTNLDFDEYAKDFEELRQRIMDREINPHSVQAYNLVKDLKPTQAMENRAKKLNKRLATMARKLLAEGE